MKHAFSERMTSGIVSMTIMLGKTFFSLKGPVAPFVMLFALCLFFSPALVLANDALTAANTALINGKYKDVERHVGGVIANGKQKPEVMARALLLRGMAYRNQGKVAQAIADFSNAEWLQKLRGVELRRLYAERALAYEAVGQKTLANKDRQLAGASAVRRATQTSDENGVRTTAVDAKSSTGSELFGGLGNLFGFNSGNNKKVQVKKVDAKKSGGEGAASIREIPTFDSQQAVQNRAKLDGKSAKTTPKKSQNNVVAKKLDENVPSNSAWAAQRLAADKRAQEQALKERAVTQKLAAKQAAVKKRETSVQRVAAVSAAEVQRKAPPVVKPGPVSQDPVVLAPKTQGQTGQNAVTSFFQNIFGGGQQASDAPLRAGEDVIAADQVASIEQNKAPVAVKRPVQVRKTSVQKPAGVKKQTPARTPSRSLYHIQVGAFGEAQAADRFVSRLNDKYKALMGQKTAMVVETDLGQSRRQYRVYLGPFRSRDKGLKSCQALKKFGMPCSLVE